MSLESTNVSTKRRDQTAPKRLKTTPLKAGIQSTVVITIRSITITWFKRFRAAESILFLGK